MLVRFCITSTVIRAATIVLFCWHQPAHIFIRDSAVMPTDCAI
jgi:NADP-dependent 3-hydroxy acid dehydrogenase YdfG